MSKQKIPLPVDFLLAVPMYEEIPYEGDEVWKVLDVLYYDKTYDCFCTKCGKESTFQVIATRRPTEHIRSHDRERMLKGHGINPELPKIQPDVHRVVSCCSRNKSHLQHFLFLIESSLFVDESKKTRIILSIQKVGQHPSYGDLNLPKLKKYAPVLTKAQLGELNRAVGLASHDVGVGAYVYLRRVFEALIEEAHQVSLNEPGWDEGNYIRSRMAEKITLLRQHLPSFLVEHPEMYSLLSRGVHELSEEDCLAHFDTLRIGIELILEEKLERKEKEKKIRDAKTALAKALGATKA